MVFEKKPDTDTNRNAEQSATNRTAAADAALSWSVSDPDSDKLASDVDRSSNGRPAALNLKTGRNSPPTVTDHGEI